MYMYVYVDIVYIYIYIYIYVILQQQAEQGEHSQENTCREKSMGEGGYKMRPEHLETYHAPVIDLLTLLQVWVA